ncbi:glycosyltransferase [Sulfitobacter aestuariivivens]|uniref:glycosyltransferase n=1 Tax=Sulfitobacter aestuariivivens TaxID=2766981 RepID=UPI003622E605
MAPVGRPDLGDLSLIEASSYFDAEWYAAQHGDPARSGLSAAEHYLWFGAAMGRDPSPWFSGTHYLGENPEVWQAGMNPLIHFLRHGLFEGRNPRADGPRLPAPLGLPDHPVLGPAPWADVERKSRLRAALVRDGLPDAPWRPTLELADTLLEGAADLPVTVILPAYRAACVDALESVMSQSLRAAEVLLVYSDNVIEHLTEIRRTHGDAIIAGQLRLIPSLGDGTAAACNTGLLTARGDLVAYLDSNSIWQPHHLKLLAAWFAECDDLMIGHTAWQEKSKDRISTLGTNPMRRAALLSSPAALDLSAVMHRRAVTDQLGGPDETLGQGALWDMLLRFTALYTPGHLPVRSVATTLDPTTAMSGTMRAKIAARHRRARFRHGIEAPRIAYVLWDWPALSQSFVMAELIWLTQRGFDVEVFYKIAPDRAAEVPVNIAQHQVDTPEELARLLRARDRTLVHCHFAYPALTRLCWPACQMAQLPFTFFAHAVDIFLHDNIARNRIDEIMSDPLCLKGFVHGDHHRRHLQQQGIPVEKLAYAFQAVDLSPSFPSRTDIPPARPAAEYLSAVSSTKRASPF